MEMLFPNDKQEMLIAYTSRQRHPRAAAEHFTRYMMLLPATNYVQEKSEQYFLNALSR
jgi:hypothetical protein